MFKINCEEEGEKKIILSIKPLLIYYSEFPMDHLPFGELKELIAEKLPNAPQKPTFKITLTPE